VPHGGGAEFGYHGDFDWGGVRIARAVRHRVNWRPWRYDHQAYEAVVSAAHPLTPLSSLVGEPAATPWDPELAAAMRHRNVRVEEELTLDALLQDLSMGTGGALRSRDDPVTAPGEHGRPAADTPDGLG